VAVGLLSALCSYVTSMVVVIVITSRSGSLTRALFFLEDQKGMLTFSVLVVVGRTSWSSKFRSKCVVEREGFLRDANVGWIKFLLHI
jgi:hypothetical protein